MNKKIIKNLIMVITSALLLLAATLAWFATIDTASVGEIKASIDKIYVDYEVEDENGNWVNINTQTVTTGMLIPGKEYRYRAIITAPETKNVLGYSVSLDGLKVTPGVGDIEITTDENGEEVTVITDKYDVREHVFVRSYVVDGAGDPPTDVENFEFASYIGKGAESVSIVRKGYFGGGGQEEEDEEPSTEDGETTTETTAPQGPSVVIEAGEKVTVYYSIMIQGQDIGQDHNLISGATLEIGKVNVIMMYDDATTNETTEPSSVTTTKSEEEA